MRFSLPTSTKLHINGTYLFSIFALHRCDFPLAPLSEEALNPAILAIIIIVSALVISPFIYAWFKLLINHLTAREGPDSVLPLVAVTGDHSTDASELSTTSDNDEEWSVSILTGTV